MNSNNDELMYKSKYLKYKTKYFRLNKEQTGGILNFIFSDKDVEIFRGYISLNNYLCYKINENVTLEIRIPDQYEASDTITATYKITNVTGKISWEEYNKYIYTETVTFQNIDNKQVLIVEIIYNHDLKVKPLLQNKLCYTIINSSIVNRITFKEFKLIDKHMIKITYEAPRPIIIKNGKYNYLIDRINKNINIKVIFNNQITHYLNGIIKLVSLNVELIDGNCQCTNEIYMFDLTNEKIYKLIIIYNHLLDDKSNYTINSITLFNVQISKNSLEQLQIIKSNLITIMVET